MKNLPNRVFNSPLINYANFKGNTHINLIRLNKPYANGKVYAVVNTANWPEYTGKLFKTYQKAKESFDLLVKMRLNELINEGVTGNPIVAN